MQRSRLVPLTILLLLLAACSTGVSRQATPQPSPRVTPTAEITPTPTIPDIPSRPVHFQTVDHVQLAGLVYRHGKTAVICSHELHTTKVIWSASGIAQRLAARGYLVLAYDFRGNGDSAGEFNPGKLAVDLQAAVAFARQQGASRIVLLGSSMGGTATLKVAASEQVAAVITLSAPQDFGVNVSDADVKAIGAPKLFVNSQDDTFSTGTMHMYMVANSPKEIHLYTGSVHGVDIFGDADGTDLTQRILNFLARYAPAG